MPEITEIQKGQPRELIRLIEHFRFNDREKLFVWGNAWWRLHVYTSANREERRLFDVLIRARPFALSDISLAGRLRLDILCGQNRWAPIETWSEGKVPYDRPSEKDFCFKFVGLPRPSHLKDALGWLHHKLHHLIWPPRGFSLKVVVMET